MPRPEAVCDKSGVYLSDCRCNAVLSISKGQPFPHCCDRRDGPTNWTFRRSDADLRLGIFGNPRDPKRKR